MTIYIAAVILAAFVQIGVIYFLRGNFSSGLPYAIPLVVLSQFLFLWSYANASKFTIIWFTTAALTSVLAFIAGYFLWQEQVSLWNIAGIVFILAGMILLQVKL